MNDLGSVDMVAPVSKLPCPRHYTTRFASPPMRSRSRLRRPQELLQSGMPERKAITLRTMDDLRADQLPRLQECQTRSGACRDIFPMRIWRSWGVLAVAL